MVKSLAAPQHGQVARLNIVEGSYSLHPALEPYYDLSVFLEISPESQRRRVLERNGPEWYANAKPGIIMEAFSVSGESNLVFIINELDKAASGKGNGNPADVLLTLLDNLGFTDNYMECMIPTTGVYPIATANNKEQISAPLMSRFAVIDIPDYTPDEKKIIFSKFALPKILKRMSLKENECKMTDEALDAVIELFSNTSGIRDLEQAAEHIAANALYQIEVNRVSEVVFTAEMVRSLLRD